MQKYNINYKKENILINNIVDQDLYELLLFEPEINNLIFEQLNIFKILENNLPIKNKDLFSNYVHFQLTEKIPVQRWFSYREGFNIKLITTFIKELNINGNIFDPFCGSGSTLLSARNNQLNSYGIDINPISVLISKSGNTIYNNDDLVDLFVTIKNLNILTRNTTIYNTIFELADNIFNVDILQSLLQIKEFIYEIKNLKIKNLFFLCWLSIIEEISNIKKEGNGIKYKNRKRTPDGYIVINKIEWERTYFPDNKFDFVKSKLIDKLKIIANDIQDNYGHIDKQPKIYHGDCLEFDSLITEQIHLSFFSPPYCNCFDYFEIHKVELWMGDFIKSKEELKNIRNMGFRSNTNSLNGKNIQYKNNNLEKIISLLNIDKLWSKRIPDVIRGYFDDFNTLLKKLYLQTTKGGYVGIVIGNSAYSGIIIPSDLLIARIAEENGFKIKNIYITRHLTTSSQQKKGLEHLKEYLRESIVLLEK